MTRDFTYGRWFALVGVVACAGFGAACGSTSDAGTPGAGGSGGQGGSTSDAGGSAGTGGSGGGDAAPPLGPAIHAKGIAVGVDHACALLDDDRVACWGANK